MRQRPTTSFVACCTLMLGACIDQSPRAADNTALAEARLWVPGAIDYRRLDAVMARPVSDDITTARVVREGGFLSCGPALTTPTLFARYAAGANADVVTGIPVSISRAKIRTRVIGDAQQGYHVREVAFRVTDATDIDGNPIALPELWIQDPSDRLTTENAVTIRDHSVDVDQSPFGILVASTGRVVLMTSTFGRTDGISEAVEVMPMDGDEVITAFDRSGALDGAIRGRFEDLRLAYDGVPIPVSDTP